MTEKANPGVIQANLILEKSEILSGPANRPTLLTGFSAKVLLKSGNPPHGTCNVDKFSIRSLDQDGISSTIYLERKKVHFPSVPSLKTIGSGDKLLKLEKTGRLRKFQIPFKLVVQNPKNIFTNIGRYTVMRKLNFSVNGVPGVAMKKVDSTYGFTDFSDGGSSLVLAINLDVFKQDFQNAQIYATYIVSYFIGKEEEDEGNYEPSSTELPKFNGFFEISVSEIIEPERRRLSVTPMRMRSSPTPSLRSTASCSFPPTYSQLNSRYPSTETLPPAYYDIQKPENLEVPVNLL